MNNNANAANKTLQAQIVAQWITSLAISVVCCAVLFIVFAGYIVDLHDTTNLLTVKLEVLQERHNQLASELTLIKRPTVVQITGAPAQAPAAAPSPDAATTPPAPGGAELPAEAQKAEEPAKDDLMPVMNEAAPQEHVLTKPSKDGEPSHTPAVKK